MMKAKELSVYQPISEELENTLTTEIITFFKQQGISIAKVDPNRRYWFIRTYAGEFFHDFIRNKVIALGWKWETGLDVDGNIAAELQNRDWDLITNGEYSAIEPHDDVAINRVASKIKAIFDNKIKKSESKEKNDIEILKQLSDDVKKYIRKAISTKNLTKILRFERNIKIGDIIVIPSQDTYELMIGEVTGDVRVLPNSSNELRGAILARFPSKRVRDVKWMHAKPLLRSSMNLKMTTLFCTHHGISDITTQYSQYINQSVFPIFEENGYYYINIPVICNDNYEFDITSYQEFFDIIDYIRNKLSITYNADFKSQQITIKLSVQSPGFMQFKSKKLLITISFVAAFLVIGGSFNIGPLSGESTGLMHHIFDYYHEYNRHEEEMSRIENSQDREALLQAAKILDHPGVSSDAPSEDLSQASGDNEEQGNNSNAKQ